MVSDDHHRVFCSGEVILQSFFLIVPLCSLFILTIYLLGEEDAIHT